MNLYRRLRKQAQVLKRFLPERPMLFDDGSFLAYVKKKRDGLLNRSDELETIALRGSTADYSFMPRLEDRAYNGGLTSSDFYTVYHQYLFARSRLKNLKNIVVFGSVFAPGFQLAKTKERYRCAAYRYFFDVPLQDSSLFEKHLVERIERRCAAISMPKIECGYNGYDKKTYFGIHIPATERLKTHLRENAREPDQVFWLQRLLDDTSGAGQKVFIILPPYRSDYRSELEDCANPEDVFRKFYALSLKGHSIIDFYLDKDFDDDCFGDTEHLTESGACLMTQKIMQKIKLDTDND